MQRTKARALAGDGGQRVQKVAGRARQPVEARDRQHLLHENADNGFAYAPPGISTAAAAIAIMVVFLI
jgi:hypothetical protein